MTPFEGLPVSYFPGFVPDPDAAFDRLWFELGWERRSGVPRREYYSNDVDFPYSYGTGVGRRTYEPRPFHPLVAEIRKRLSEITGSKFEVCFANGYDDGKDQLGWHADDSPEMDDERPIGVVSLGARREIWFCPKEDKKNVSKLFVDHGSLCLMHSGMQDTHLHRIPKSSIQGCGPRLSLTFRGYAEDKK